RAAKDPKDGAAWMLLGLLEMQRGRDADAVTAFRSAEARRPGDALAPYYLGQSLVLAGQGGAAAQAFERALALNPANPNDPLDTSQARARVHQRAYHTDQALAVWKRLEQRSPDDLRVLEQIATALAEEGLLDQALPRLETLVRKTAGQPERQTPFRL